jgi:hypothetical protein
VLLDRLIALLLVATSTAIAAEAQSFWLDADGKAAVDTPDRRSVEGFGGWLLITSDQDWRTKWNTPRETAPKFNTTDSPRRGQKVFVLIFVGNPKLDIDRTADVTCDIRLTGPNGTVPIDVRNMDCFKGPVSMDPRNIFVSAPVIEFLGEPGDPLGNRVLEVVLRDNNRKVEVPLRKEFELKP